MKSFIPCGPFTYRRSSDGCDETFDVVAVPTGEFVVAFHFWEEEERSEARARWLAAALNLSHAISHVTGGHQSGLEAETPSVPVASTKNLDLRRDRSDRFARGLAGASKFEQMLSLSRIFADAKHWCDQSGVDFDDALLHASSTFHSER